MTTATRTLHRLLTRQKRIWQASLLAQALLRAAAWALGLLAPYMILDFFLGFSPASLYTINLFLAVFLACQCGRALVQILRLTDRDAAIRADILLADRRRTILGARELLDWLRLHALQTETPGGFLAIRAVENAGRRLAEIPFRRSVPEMDLRKQARMAGLALLAVLVLLVLPSNAGRTILRRICRPGLDIPPYSRHSFTVHPARPTVVYGQNAEIAVEIAGAPVNAPVLFLTRQGNRTQQTVCFQESATRFAQRLERVVSPLEFCFSTGTGRSRWNRVDVLLQPRVTVARFLLTPPDYSRQGKRELLSCPEGLSGIKGTSVELVLTSNRPLSGGAVTLRSHGSGKTRTVPGHKSQTHSVSFQWIMTEPARIEAVIRDVQQTRNDQPFIVEQKILPDAPPEAVISEPGAFSLATPATRMPLSGYATDDLGLKNVDLVLALAGFRDRMKHLGPTAPATRLPLERTLDLKALGAEPGQLIECCLEASDFNPDMTGIGASDMVRIQIISEQDYAQVLRARVTLEDFQARFAEVERQFADWQKALEQLRDKLADPAASEQQKQAALEETLRQNRKVTDVLRKIRDDFSVYDAEDQLRKTLTPVLENMDMSHAKLASAKAGDAGLAETVRDMLSRWKQTEQAQIQQQKGNAAEIALLASISQSASRYKQLIARQDRLVRQASRYSETPPSRDMPLLASLRKEEESINADLLELQNDLLALARQAHGRKQYDKLERDMVLFSQNIVKQEIPDLLQKAIETAQNQDGAAAHRHARLALERMNKLLSEACQGGSGFGDMANCSLRFSVKKDIQPTVQQILAAAAMGFGMGAWGNKPGTGNGTGAGGGGGMGDLNDGYWAGGYSPLNTPVFGPDRMSFQKPPDSTRATGASQTGRKDGTASLDERARESMQIKERSTPEGESVQMGTIPEKYRDAIKKYFSGDR